MVDPIRDDAVRAELDELGLRHFLDVRATVRSMLATMGGPQRAAFAAAVAQRPLREDERLPAAEREPRLVDWRPVLAQVWQLLSGDAAARHQVATAVGAFYQSPEYHERRHDDAADDADHAIMTAFYSAECGLHGCLEFAAWAGWRGFDRAAVAAAADPSWAPRRPAEVSGYAWDLAHPAIQAELDQQLTDLELLAVDGGVLDDAVADRRPLLRRLQGESVAIS